MRRTRRPQVPPSRPDRQRQSFPSLPYAAPAAGQLGKDNAPPKRYEVLKPDLDVEPQPRKAGGDPSLTTGTPKAADKTVPQNQPAKKGDEQSPGDSKGPKPGGQPQAPTGGQPQGGSNGNAPTGTGGQPQGPAGGQQPRTAGGQEAGASPGQQKVNPQNQTPDDSKKDKKSTFVEQRAGTAKRDEGRGENTAASMTPCLSTESTIMTSSMTALGSSAAAFVLISRQPYISQT